MKIQDYYDIIGVGREAGTDEIKRSYRSLVKQWHPDRHEGDAKLEAEERFKEISEAYEVLSDPERRRQYDEFVDQCETWGGAADAAPDGRDVEFDAAGFFDLFDSLNHAQSIRGIERREPLVSHAVCVLSVSQTLSGGMARVRVPSEFLCSSCATGRVEEMACSSCGREVRASMRAVDFAIPDDAYDGMQIRLEGVGPPCEGDRSDLMVTLRIVSDEHYQRDGLHVHAPVSIAPWEAAFGAKVAVRGPTGDLLVTIPAGARNGLRLRLAGRGLRDVNGRRGDFYLTVQIDLPERMSDRERDLLMAMRDGSTAVRGGVRIAE